MNVILCWIGENLEVRSVFFEHFSKLLNATRTSLTALIEQAWTHDERTANSRFDVPVDINCIPNFRLIAHILKSQKSGKGLGEDLIGSEVAHVFPVDVATLIFPLMFKSATLISAQLQWKGGQI